MSNGQDVTVDVVRAWIVDNLKGGDTRKRMALGMLMVNCVFLNAMCL